MRISALLLICLLIAGCTSRGTENAMGACPYTAGRSTIQVPGRPFAIEASSDGCWLFASLMPGETVEKYASNGVGNPADKGGIAVLRNEGGRFGLVRVVGVPGEAAGLALSHDGAILAAAAGDVSVVLDVGRLKAGSGDAVLGVIPQGDGAEAIDVAISRDDRLLFTSNEEAAQVTVADLARARRDGFDRDNIIGRIPVGGGPVGMALSPDGRRLYVTSREMPPPLGFPNICKAEAGDDKGLHSQGGLLTIDAEMAAENPTQALLAVAPAGCNPVRVALSRDGTTAWVTARGDGAVLSFQTGQLETVPPMAASCTQSAPLAKLTCPDRRRDPPHQTVAVGSSPVGVAVSLDNKQVWVVSSNRFSDTERGFLTLIRASPDRHANIGGHVASGLFPRDIRFLPDGKTLAVAVFRSEELRLLPADGE